MGFVMNLARRSPLAVLILFLPVLVFAAEEGERKPESACISCHRDLGGKMAEPIGLWEKSYHRQMGNNCDGCHGGDPTDPAAAMSPEKGFVGAPKPDQIASFCGKCHVGVVENYMKSPHYAASLERKGPNCVTCHHSHDVQRASFELISEPLCSQCHSYENGQKMKKAFISAEMALQEAGTELRHLDQRGMPVKRIEEKLFALRNSLHQMTHTLDVPEIENKTKAALSEVGEMRKEMEGLYRRIHRRWWIGAGIAGFLIVLIVVLIRLLKTYEEE